MSYIDVKDVQLILLGITTKLLGWRLAITVAKLTWNHSVKPSGSKSLNPGARAVKVRFKMVPRTAGFVIKVMFFWKWQDTLFSSRGSITRLYSNESKFGDIECLCTSVHGGHDWAIICNNALIKNVRNASFLVKAVPLFCLCKHALSPGKICHDLFVRQPNGKRWQFLN